MKKLINSSVFPKDVGNILMKEITRIDEAVVADEIKRKTVVFELHVSFGIGSNPIVSIIKDEKD